MAFPQVIDAFVTSFNSDATSHQFNLPGSGINAGDLLVAIWAFDATTTVTVPGGWTEIRAPNGVNINCGACALIASGSEDGSTIDVVTDNAQQGQVLFLQIRDIFDTGSIANSIVSSSPGTAVGSSSPNPSSFTPGFGAVDVLWFTIICCDDTAETVTSPPSNYDNLVGGGATGGTASAEVFAARREFNAASVNPPAWSTSVGNWSMFMLAVRGTAAAPATPKGLMLLGAG